MELTQYNIENWQVKFPSEWEFSVDEERNPPQFVFDTKDVTVYVSVWNWRNSNGEMPDKDTIVSILEQGFSQQKLKLTDEYAAFYPENFQTISGQGFTGDGYEMISFAVCGEGTAVTLYFVFEKGTEKERYLELLRYADKL